MVFSYLAWYTRSPSLIILKPKIIITIVSPGKMAYHGAICKKA